MQQKDLATLLDISPAMVSRLAKRGMPTDTLERAQRWRKRHLEPGRVKGNRLDLVGASAASTKKPSTVRPASPGVTCFDLEAAGELVDAALARGNQYGAAIRTWRLRGLLRQCPHEDGFRLNLRVWLALTDWEVDKESAVRSAPDMEALLTPAECGQRLSPINPWPAHVVLDTACDWDDIAIDGYPEYCFDDDDGA